MEKLENVIFIKLNSAISRTFRKVKRSKLYAKVSLCWFMNKKYDTEGDCQQFYPKPKKKYLKKYNNTLSVGWSWLTLKCD